MGQTIDYTTWRKGRRSPDGVIAICTVCGRKGAYHPAGHDVYGGGLSARYIHVLNDLGSPYGIHTQHVVQMCVVPDSKPAPIGAAARAAERERKRAGQ